MAAGAMRYRIAIERTTQSRGSAGGVANNWAGLATVWGEYQPNRGREFFAARGLLAETNAVFKIRYRTDVTAKERVVFRSRVYNIIDAVAEEGRARYMLLYCSTGVIPGGL